MTLGKVGGLTGPAATPAHTRGEEPFRRLLHEVERSGDARGSKGPAQAAGDSGAAGTQRAGRTLEVGPRQVGPVSAGPARGAAAVATAPAADGVAVRVVEQVAAAQRRLDHVLRVAQSGRTFTPAELLALQAHVYRASEELDLAGKVVEKAAGGVKQVLQTQV